MAADTNIQLVDLNKLYPVGCVYITATNINPNTFLNIGAWSLIESGKMIMSASNTDKGLETGGSMSKSVPLLAHTHSFTPAGSVSSHTHTGPSHSHTGTTGADNPKHIHSIKHSHFTCSDGGIVASMTSDSSKKRFAAASSGSNYTLVDASANITKKYNTDTCADFSGNPTVDHTHTFTTAASGTGATGAATPTFTGTASNTGSTGTANATMDITPSYIKLFIWQRTA